MHPCVNALIFDFYRCQTSLPITRRALRSSNAGPFIIKPAICLVAYNASHAHHSDSIYFTSYDLDTFKSQLFMLIKQSAVYLVNTLSCKSCTQKCSSWLSQTVHDNFTQETDKHSCLGLHLSHCLR